MKYVAGIFMIFCSIAQLWGQTSSGKWMQLGPDLPGGVICMTELRGELYAVHHTTEPATADPGSYALSRWNGVTWTTLSQFQGNGFIDCMIAYRGDIYLGGSFSFFMNGQQETASGLARWDGAAWHRVTGGILDEFKDMNVLSLSEFRGDLYCSGTFIKSGARSVAVIRFDGSRWTTPGNTPYGGPGDSSVSDGYSTGRSMQSYKGDLYLGGKFRVNGTITSLARWDGTAWAEVPGAEQKVFHTLAVYNDELVCYRRADYLGRPSDLTFWNGQHWSGTGRFPSSLQSASDMVAYDGRLYIAGVQFNSISRISNNIILRWDGTLWDTAVIFRQPDAGRIDLMVLQDRLYTGGMFTSIDEGVGIPLRYIGMLCDDGVCGSISGIIFSDTDDDCMPDSTEQRLRRRVVEIHPGPLYAVSDDDGYYRRYLLPGTYTVGINPHQHWDITCPSSPGTRAVTIINANDVLRDISFGVQPNAIIRDTRISMVSGPARAGRDLIYHIIYENVGTVTTSGTIRLFLDPILSFDHSMDPPTRIQSPLLEWDFSGLEVGEERTIKVLAGIPATVQRGLFICSNIEIVNDDPVFGIDNRDSVCVEVTGSYDPNDISVIPYGVEDNGEITPQDSVLTYTVRFQNTGNDTAFKVVVIDTLSNHLDISSIRLGAASHPFSFNIDGENILTWTFDDIMLPDSNASEPNSHGIFKYSVHLRPGLPAGTTIPNRASIYFDYNAPVITNTVRTTISGVLSVPEPLTADAVEIFPNPVRGNLRVVAEMQPGSIIEVQDIVGRTMMEQRCDGGEITLDMSLLPAGTYFVKIPSRSGTIVRQVNVMR